MHTGRLSVSAVGQPRWLASQQRRPVSTHGPLRRRPHPPDGWLAMRAAQPGGQGTHRRWGRAPASAAPARTAPALLAGFGRRPPQQTPPARSRPAAWAPWVSVACGCHSGVSSQTPRARGGTWGWSSTQKALGSVTNTTQGAAQLRRGEAGVPSPADTHPKVSGERGVTMGEPGGDSWVGDSPSSPLPLAALPMGAGACVRAPLAAPDRLSTGSRGV